VINPNNSGTISMALTTVVPLVEYQCQIINMALVPAPNTTTTPGTYCAAPFDVPGQSSWWVEISFIQDWGATPSLSEFLLTNDGELCDFEFEPDVAGTPSMTGEVYVIAGPYGGDAGQVWQATTLRWPMRGAPTLVPAALAAAAAE
jgi:hypothetical protein